MGWHSNYLNAFELHGLRKEYNMVDYSKSKHVNVLDFGADQPVRRIPHQQFKMPLTRWPLFPVVVLSRFLRESIL